jgi:hypothetical protein
VLLRAQGAEVEGDVGGPAGFGRFRERDAKVPAGFSTFMSGCSAEIGLRANDSALELRTGLTRKAAKLGAALGHKACDSASDRVGHEPFMGKEVGIWVEWCVRHVCRLLRAKREAVHVTHASQQRGYFRKGEWAANPVPASFAGAGLQRGFDEDNVIERAMAIDTAGVMVMGAGHEHVGDKETSGAPRFSVRSTPPADNSAPCPCRVLRLEPGDFANARCFTQNEPLQKHRALPKEFIGGNATKDSSNGGILERPARRACAA